mmetsp:Transcript_174657/g.560088  ORF Transcript_174657/g.560088 Transcript_174657/m.560088 type:complete len:89 (+) Transcript_174657:169-435(+)
MGSRVSFRKLSEEDQEIRRTAEAFRERVVLEVVQTSVQETTTGRAAPRQLPAARGGAGGLLEKQEPGAPARMGSSRSTWHRSMLRGCS